MLERALRLLHPLCPFLTEEIWQLLPHAGATLTKAPWPRGGAVEPDRRALEEFGQVMEVVRAVRNLRAEKKVDPRRRVRAVLAAPQEWAGVLGDQAGLMGALAGMDVEFAPAGAEPPREAAAQMAGKVQVYLPLKGLLDPAAERERLGRERTRLLGLRQAQTAKLANTAFVERAPAAVVQAERAKLAAWETALGELERSLQALGA